MTDRKQITRELYRAFSAGDRDFFEKHLAPELTFSSPPDPKLDREGFFERCWPGAGQGQGIDIVRLVESGNEVVLTYELKRPDGSGRPEHRGPHLRGRSGQADRGLLRLGHLGARRRRR